MATASILWRGIERPGHEYARLRPEPSQWQLEGVALFSHQHLPCRLHYQIIGDSSWHTRSCLVSGWVGEEQIAIEIKTDGHGRWLLNGNDCPGVEGCLDVDLNFSPSTNLLPIRRLALAVGQEAEVKAAWLRFPGFAFETLEQVYQRADDHTYRYSCHGGTFVAELRVNDAGFVTHYPNLWVAE